jgi:flagellar biosynthesis component FlhA
MATTIQIDEKLKSKLDILKVHKRESYNELISRLISNCSLENVSRESLTETIEILSSPETMRNIAEALENLENKRGESWEHIKREVKLNV